MLGELLGLSDGILQSRVQRLRVAQMYQPHAGLVQFPGLRLNLFGQDGQKPVHFIGGAAPVLGGKGVESHHGHSTLSQRAHHVANVGHTLLVPRPAGQIPAGGPTTVAIHDDGDMVG